MKKILLFLLCLSTFVATNAQTKAPKVNYLPQEGDWAIGIDVMPIFKYIGNAFNGNTYNELNHLGGTPFTENYSDFTLTPDVSIMGKYMLTDEWGLRVNAGVMIRSEYLREYVQNDKAIMLDPLSEDKNIDKLNYNRNGLSLALGAEYRKGSRKVQGVFGFGVLFAFQNEKYTCDWGNEMTSVNQVPTITPNFGGYNNGYRTLKYYDDNARYYTGLTGSAGVEWFIWPKISLGAEVNLSAYYIFGSQSYREKEGYNGASNKVEVKTDILSPGDRGFYLGTESLGGSLNMTFYF